jgi:hypothetical protein
MNPDNSITNQQAKFRDVPFILGLASLGMPIPCAVWFCCLGYGLIEVAPDASEWLFMSEGEALAYAPLAFAPGAAAVLGLGLGVVGLIVGLRTKGAEKRGIGIVASIVGIVLYGLFLVWYLEILLSSPY